MDSRSFGFIGGGRVVKILLNALKNKGKLPQEIIVSDVNEDVLNNLKNEFPQITITKDNSEPAKCGYVFISLHPPVMAQVLESVKSAIREDAVVISLAPKFSIEKISSLLAGFNKIVRMIPNAPSYINKGYNPVSYSNTLTLDEKKELNELFSLWGEYPEVKECNLESYAILTAMGPTYLWFQLGKIHEAGLSFGLTEEELKDGITSMVKGAVATLYNSGLSIKEVIDLVPVKPMAEFENGIIENYNTALNAIFNKLKN